MGFEILLETQFYICFIPFNVIKIIGQILKLFIIQDFIINSKKKIIIRYAIIGLLYFTNSRSYIYNILIWLPVYVLHLKVISKTI